MPNLKSDFRSYILQAGRFFSKRSWIFLILILALALRLININQSLWLDEAISFEAATKYSLRDLFLQFLPKDFNPPLYYLILHFWLRFFPPSELFLRLPSVIFGFFTCFLIYKIYHLVFMDKKGALLALTLMATGPLLIYYSQEVRTYSLTTFLVCSSVYYFIKFLQCKKRLLAACYSLFTILMLYSHYLIWLILPAQWLYFFNQKNKDRKLTFNLLICQFVIFFSYLPWLPILIRQLRIAKRIETDSNWGQVLGEASFKNIALIPVKFIIGRTSFDNKIWYGFLVIILVLFFGFLIAKAFFYPFRKNPPDGGDPGSEKWMIGFWLLVPIILGSLISFKIPLLTYFRFLFCLPAFYLLVSRGVMMIKNKKAIIILLLGLNLFFSLRYLLDQNFHRENWEEAVELLHQKNTADAPVLIFQNVSAPFSYYDRKKSSLIFIYEKESILDFDCVWLIPYSQPIFDPHDQTREWLESQGFIRTFEQHFRGVTLEKWQKLLLGRGNGIIDL